MPEYFFSRPAIAAAMGLDRSTITTLPNFPEPDIILRGANGRETFGWHQATIEHYAWATGRKLNWDQ